MFACEGFIRIKWQMKQMGPILSASISNFKIEFHLSVCIHINCDPYIIVSSPLFQSRLWQHYWFGCLSVPREPEEFLMLLSLMQVIGPKEVACGWSICYPPGPPTDLQTDHEATESKSRCLVLSYCCSEKNVWWLKGDCWRIGLSKE